MSQKPEHELFDLPKIRGKYLYLKISADKANSHQEFPQDDVLFNQVIQKLNEWFPEEAPGLQKVLIANFDKETKICQYELDKELSAKGHPKPSTCFFEDGTSKFNLQFVRTLFTNAPDAWVNFTFTFYPKGVSGVTFENGKMINIPAEEFKTIYNEWRGKQDMKDKKPSTSKKQHLEDFEVETPEGKKNPQDPLIWMLQDQLNQIRCEFQSFYLAYETLKKENANLIAQVKSLEKQVQSIQANTRAVKMSQADFEVKLDNHFAFMQINDGTIKKIVERIGGYGNN